MNNVETSSIAGEYLQAQIVEPWFIGRERIPENKALIEQKGKITRNAFIEYYY